MKLRNKKTREIVVFGEGIVDLRRIGCANVAEMIEAGWEDYEEEPCFISEFGKVHPISCMGGDRQRVKWLKEIGNYFETEEEAKKAVEKFKAWRRLEDNGAKFEGWKRDEEYCGDYTIKMADQFACDDKDLDLLFGGEE